MASYPPHLGGGQAVVVFDYSVIFGLHNRPEGSEGLLPRGGFPRVLIGGLQPRADDVHGTLDGLPYFIDAIGGPVHPVDLEDERALGGVPLH